MDDLIDLIYETIVDPALWSAVARRMSEQLDAQSFWMFHMDSTGPDFLALQGLSPRLLEAYEAHFHSRDILMEEELRRPQDFLGRAVREQDIVGETVWQASEIYNDLARPNGMHHVLSMNLSSAQTQAVPFLTFFRPPGTTMFDDAAVSSCENIIPHLRRAIRLNRLICVRRGAIPEWTATLLDQIPAGIFLLDGRGAVLHANRAAQAIVARRDGLAIKGGRLIAAGGQPDAGLERIIAACVSTHRRGGEIRLERAEGHWLLSICPLSEAAVAGVTAESDCRGWVWLSDAVPTPGDMARRLEALFGLTAAEQRVAAALARRLSPAEIAAQNGVTLNTVRTQMKSIFGKLGVGRQVDVMHLLAEISALPTPR
jgi:DNA-binding CsgD family transcriptional regulator/PAS domain-containing protein